MALFLFLCPAGQSWAEQIEAPSQAPFVGVVLTVDRLNPSQIDYLVSLGVRQVSMPIVAERFPSDLKEAWDELRQTILTLRRVGIDVVPVLELRNADPDRAEALAELIFLRLGDLISALVLFNRLNWRSGFDRDFLREAVKRIVLMRDVLAPGVKLILGGVMGRDEVWLDKYSGGSLLDRVDGIGFDLRPLGGGVEAIGPGDVGAPDDVGGFAELIPRLKQRGLEVWLTEVGTNTGPPGTGADQVTQASIVGRALVMAKQVGFDRAFVYSAWDRSPRLEEVEMNMGLGDVNLTPKMSYEVVRRLIPILDQSQVMELPPLAQVRLVPEFPGQNTPVFWSLLRNGDRLFLIWWNRLTGLSDLTTGLFVSGLEVEAVRAFDGFNLRPATFHPSRSGKVLVVNGLPISAIPSWLEMRLISEPENPLEKLPAGPRQEVEHGE